MVHAIGRVYEPRRSYLRPCLNADLDTPNWRHTPFDPVETNYQRVVGAVRAGKTQEPSFRRAANIQKVLDMAQVSDREHKDALVNA